MYASGITSRWSRSAAAASCPDGRKRELQTMVTHIGRTPMERLHLVIGGKARTVHLKLEGANPGGSVKDRTALSLIEYLEQRGTLAKDSILIESTSGNLGVSLSLVAAAKRYAFVAVVDPKTTAENLAKMRRLGAQIETVSEPDEVGGYLLTRLERVRVMCATSRKYIWTNQYESPANPNAHYLGTGSEIFQQMNGKLDAVFIAVSTGGTLAGISRYLREVSPQTHIIGVDARGSMVFGTHPGSRKLTGIGSSRRSNFITADLYDEYILVGDEDAFSFCRALFAATGIKVGGSSGAVLAACAQYLSNHRKIDRVVCLSADDGRNYETSIFSDAWLAQHGFDTSATRLLGPVQDITLHQTSRFRLTAPLKPGLTEATTSPAAETTSGRSL